VTKAKTARDRNAAVEPSALDALLAAEQQITAQAADVAAECEAIVAAARAATLISARDAAAILEAEIAVATEEAGRAAEAVVRGIDDDAARTIARYGDLSDAEVDRLAEWVAERVTGVTMPVTSAR
jgi:hypothetical protein